MSVYFQNGSIFTVSRPEDANAFPSLPVGNYVVNFDPDRGRYFLVTTDSFNIPDKLYGDIAKTASRILNTFNDRSASTGVLLSGEKGSGKTLMAKKLSLDAAALGIPTLIVNQPFRGDAFNSFISSIDQSVVVLFDEFEKVYRKGEFQEDILTLLDGVFPSKKLFVLTCNNKFLIDINMKNRPGRLYYMLDYDGLSKDFIREYCEDTLHDKSKIDAICSFSVAFESFNFDILQAIVEEINRYGESVKDAVSMLNAKPSLSKPVLYDIKLVSSGNLVIDKLYDEYVEVNPFTSKFNVDYRYPDSRGGHDSDRIFFTPDDIISTDKDNGTIRFKSADGVVIDLSKKRVRYGEAHDLIF